MNIQHYLHLVEALDLRSVLNIRCFKIAVVSVVGTNEPYLILLWLEPINSIL